MQLLQNRLWLALVVLFSLSTMRKVSEEIQKSTSYLTRVKLFGEAAQRLTVVRGHVFKTCRIKAIINESSMTMHQSNREIIS